MTKKKMSQELIKIMDKTDPLGDIEHLSFHKFMQLLCPPNDQFHGCEMLFVDTAFFDRKLGKATEIILTNKDGFLSSIKSDKRLKFLQIQAHFSEIVRERRKALPPAWANQYYDNDEPSFERQFTSNQFRTTFGSDINGSDGLNRMQSGMTNDMLNTLSKQLLGPNESIIERERSFTDIASTRHGAASFSQQRSNQTQGAARQSTMTRKSNTTQTTKKGEKATLLDLAVFRFDVDPDSISQNALLGCGGGGNFNDQSSMSFVQSAQNINAGSQHDALVHQKTLGIGSEMALTGHQTDFVSQPYVKVVSEAMFLKMMSERATSRQWRAISCIQSCIKAQRGLGKHIPIKFSMQIDYEEEKKQKEIYYKNRQAMDKVKTLGLNYDYQEIGREFVDEIMEESRTTYKKYSNIEMTQIIEQKLKIQRPRDFCLRQVLKMCYYLQKLHQKEILQVNCDFYQDDNGEIYFAFAEDILVRQLLKSPLEQEAEDYILEQQKIKREKRDEWKRLEKAEWKDFQKKLHEEELKRRNIFKEHQSQISALKMQRRLKKEEKQAQLDKIQKLSKQIGIGDEDQTVEGAPPKRQLSQREIKIKKYAETFHTYFMRQRKDIGVDKMLDQNSDSEIEDHLEKRVDNMIDARQKQESRDAKNQSILAQRKALNYRKELKIQQGKKVSSTISTSSLTAKRVANETFKKIKASGADYQSSIDQRKNTSQKESRKLKNSMMRAQRFDITIDQTTMQKSVESDSQIDLEYDYLTSQILRKRQQTGILDGRSSAERFYLDQQMRSTIQPLQSHKNDRNISTGLTNAKTYFNIKRPQNQSTQRSGGGISSSNGPFLEQSFTSQWPFLYQQNAVATSTQNKSAGFALQRAIKDKNYQTARQAVGTKKMKNVPYSKQQQEYGSVISGNIDTKVLASHTSTDFQATAAFEINQQNDLVGASSLVKDSQTQSSAQKQQSGPRNVGLVQNPTQSIPQVTTNRDGTRSFMINQDSDVESSLYNSRQQLIMSHLKKTQSQMSTLQAPHTADSSHRTNSRLVGLKTNYAGHISNGGHGRDSQHIMTLNDTHASSWEPFANVGKSQGRLLGQEASESAHNIRLTNAYFNVNKSKGRQSVLQEKIMRQRSVQAGKTSRDGQANRGKKSTGYMRPIDMIDQERTHFFHLPDATQDHSTSSMAINVPKRNNVTAASKHRSVKQKRASTSMMDSDIQISVAAGAVASKKSSVIVTGIKPVAPAQRNKQSVNREINADVNVSGQVSSRQMSTTNRTTLMSKYQIPLSSSAALTGQSMNRRTRVNNQNTSSTIYADNNLN